MEEINRFNNEDVQQLRKAVESQCNITLADEKERLGELSFHLYRYHQINGASKRDDSELVFQVRYGMQPIYSYKHLKLHEQSNYLAELVKIIQQNKSTIKSGIIEYCHSQLETILTMEIEPLFNKKFPFLYNYELKLCKSGIKNQKMQNKAWLSLCIIISWTDDFGEFQEFLYPLRIDPLTHRFQMDVNKILSSFQIYRDSLV